MPRRLPLPTPLLPHLPLGTDSASAPVATPALPQQLPRRLLLQRPPPPHLPLGAFSTSPPVATSALPQQLPRRLSLQLSPPPLIPSAQHRNLRMRIPMVAVYRVMLRPPLKARFGPVSPPPTLSLPSVTAGPSIPPIWTSRGVPPPLPLFLPHEAVPQPPPEYSRQDQRLKRTCSPKSDEDEPALDSTSVPPSNE